jgi:cytidyltransferase-like protein
MTNKKVIIFGTFDVFHEGHKDLIRQARKFGDYLIVVVGRDETVKSVKGQYPLNDEEKRMGAIKKSNLAEEVVLGELDDKYAIIEKKMPDVICLGYDQNFFVDGLREELKKRGLSEIEIRTLEAYKPEIYKSSKLKK